MSQNTSDPFGRLAHLTGLRDIEGKRGNAVRVPGKRQLRLIAWLAGCIDVPPGARAFYQNVLFVHGVAPTADREDTQQGRPPW